MTKPKNPHRTALTKSQQKLLDAVRATPHHSTKFYAQKIKLNETTVHGCMADLFRRGFVAWRNVSANGARLWQASAHLKPMVVPADVPSIGKARMTKVYKTAKEVTDHFKIPADVDLGEGKIRGYLDVGKELPWIARIINVAQVFGVDPAKMVDAMLCELRVRLLEVFDKDNGS